MKFISKTILRRTASDPTPTTATESSSSSMSKLTVDLANKDALPALRVLKQSPSMNKNVTSAIVNTDSCVWYGQIKMDFQALIEVFQCLGDLPRLQTLTINLSHLQVPASALAGLLQGAKALRELHLIDVNVVGSVVASGLDVVLQAHTKLNKVRFVRCRGSDCIRSFITNLPNLKKIELRHTAVGDNDINNNNKTTNPWIHLGRSTQLQSLTIQEIPDLKTDHILTFTNSLSHQQSEGTSNLQELHITSSGNTAVNGQLCGPALIDLFLVYPSSSIKTLTLKFGPTWKTIGNTVSTLIQKNSSLTSLCIELATKDLIDQGLQIISALKHNSILKRMKLCLDEDQQLDGPLDSRLKNAMEKVLLEHNHTLQSLVVMDDSRERYPLTASIRHKLELNSSRLPKILHSTSASTSTTSSRRRTSQNNTNEYLRAMIDSKDNLNAVYYCFVNQPNLLLDLSPTAQSLLSSEEEGGDSKAHNKSLSSCGTRTTASLLDSSSSTDDNGGDDDDDSQQDPVAASAANFSRRRNQSVPTSEKSTTSTRKRLLKLFK